MFTKYSFPVDRRCHTVWLTHHCRHAVWQWENCRCAHGFWFEIINTITSEDTHQKPSFNKLSIEHAAAIRMPSSFMTAARSIPLSSAKSICRKSPTLWDTGRSANWHFSFRLGNGTVTCGNPLMYLIVTSEKYRERKKISNINFPILNHFNVMRIKYNVELMRLDYWPSLSVHLTVWQVK